MNGGDGRYTPPMSRLPLGLPDLEEALEARTEASVTEPQDAPHSQGSTTGQLYSDSAAVIPSSTEVRRLSFTSTEDESASDKQSADKTILRCNSVTGKVEFDLPPLVSERELSYNTTSVRRQISEVFALDPLDSEPVETLTRSIWGGGGTWGNGYLQRNPVSIPV